MDREISRRAQRVRDRHGGFTSGVGEFATEMAAPKHDEDRAWAMLGEFIRGQRQLARLSLRQLADMARVSNPYLSQIERGLYRPSAQVLKGLADALHISAESLYSQVGLLDEGVDTGHSGVEAAIRLDPKLSSEQKDILLRMYHSLLGSPVPAPPRTAARRAPAAKRVGVGRKGTPTAERRSRKP